MMVSTKFHPNADGDVATSTSGHVGRRRRLLHDQCPYTPCTSLSWKGLMTVLYAEQLWHWWAEHLILKCVKQWRLSSRMLRYLILRMEPVFWRATLRRFCDMRHGVVAKHYRSGSGQQPDNSRSFRSWCHPVLNGISLSYHTNICLCVSHLFKLQVYLSHMYIYFLGNLNYIPLILLIHISVHQWDGYMFFNYPFHVYPFYS